MSNTIPDVLHPVRGDQLTPLERQLWRLRMVTLEAQVMLRGYNSVDNVANTIPDGLLFSLSNHALVIVTKFFEVWKAFGALARTDARVVPVRRAVSPLVRRIEVWEGLELFRNTTLAHPYTTKDDRLVGPWHLMEQHQVPTYHSEVILILQCMMFAVAGTLAAFNEEYRALSPSFKAGTVVPDRGPGIQRGEEIGETLKPLLVSVDAALQAMGVPARNPVFAEFRRELEPREVE